MSRRLRRALPKSAMRLMRDAIGAGPQQLLTRVPADDNASRGEFSRVRHPHLLFSCIFRSPPAAHCCRLAADRAAALPPSAAADDHAARGEFARVRHPRLLFSCIFRSSPTAAARRRTARRSCARRPLLMTIHPGENSPPVRHFRCFFAVFTARRPALTPARDAIDVVQAATKERSSARTKELREIRSMR
jgi:hypothetical protein